MKNEITELFKIQELIKQFKNTEYKLKQVIHASNLKDRIQRFNTELYDFENSCIKTVSEKNPRLYFKNISKKYNICLPYEDFSIISINDSNDNNEYFVIHFTAEYRYSDGDREEYNWTLMIPFDEANDEKYINIAKDEIMKYWNYIVDSKIKEENIEKEEKLIRLKKEIEMLENKI